MDGDLHNLGDGLPELRHRRPKVENQRQNFRRESVVDPRPGLSAHPDRVRLVPKTLPPFRGVNAVDRQRESRQVDAHLRVGDPLDPALQATEWTRHHDPLLNDTHTQHYSIRVERVKCFRT